MFPSTTTSKNTSARVAATRLSPLKTSPTIEAGTDRRSLRELLRDALGTAIEFATLGEATIPPSRESRPAAPVHSGDHPHRRALVRPSRPRRPGSVRARAQVCTAPVGVTPAGRQA